VVFSCQVIFAGHFPFFGGNGRISRYLLASPSAALLFRGCQGDKKYRRYAVECAAERVIVRCCVLPKADFLALLAVRLKFRPDHLSKPASHLFGADCAKLTGEKWGKSWSFGVKPKSPEGPFSPGVWFAVG